MPLSSSTGIPAAPAACWTTRRSTSSTAELGAPAPSHSRRAEGAGPSPRPGYRWQRCGFLVTVRCGVADDGGQVAAGPGQQFQELVAVGISPNRTDRDRRRAQGGEVGDRVRGATGAVLFAIEGEDHHGVLARDPAEVPDEVVVEPEAPTTTTRSPPKKASGDPTEETPPPPGVLAVSASARLPRHSLSGDRRPGPGGRRR
jgi:hypothetical protein